MPFRYIKGNLNCRARAQNSQLIGGKAESRNRPGGRWGAIGVIGSRCEVDQEKNKSNVGQRTESFLAKGDQQSHQQSYW